MTQIDDLFGETSSEPRPAAETPAPAPRRAAAAPQPANSYSAADIEVLEGLEPVRRRPGMYIGGTDSNALHHLFAEVIDNSMDEAIGGYATRIEVDFSADGYVTVNLAGHYNLDERFTLFARADNLFDESYQNPVGFLGSEQAFYAGVQAKL